MLINKTTYFIDTTKGPIHKTRYSLNLRFLFGILLCTIIVAGLIAVAAVSYEPPIVKAHVTNANIIVLQDLEDNYIAYVQYASVEQVEEMKKLRIEFDESLADFKYCVTEVKHYEIRLNDELVYVHAPDVNVPAKYNYTLSDQELNDMLSASSEEVNYIYEEFNKIFKIDA